MKKYSILLLFSLMSTVVWAQTDETIEMLLDSLEMMISEQENYISEKEERIEQVRSHIRHGANAEEEYTMNSLLYDEYYVYDADTALNITKRNLQIAEQLGKKDWHAEWKIKSSFIYAATGMLPQALDQIADIKTEELPANLKVELYRQYIYIYSHFGQYAGETEEAKKYYKMQDLYVDSICSMVSKDDPLYLWQQAWGREPQLVKDAIAKAIKNSEMNTRYDAMNAYCLSHIYEREGNVSERIKYLILSAMADVRCCNRDIAAMEELAKWLFSQGEIEHSYNFINYCMENDRLYHNRVHMISLSEVNKDIHDAYMERMAHQKDVLRIFIGVMIVLLIALAALMVMVLLSMRRVKASRTEVADANEHLQASNHELEEARSSLSDANNKLSILNNQLTEVNAQLTEANSNLRDTNYVKEEMIGYVFSICSQYISKQDDFRKHMLRLLKTGKMDEIRKTVEKPVQQSELKEFFHTFDQVFLSIYPDFIEDFNALLRPEERISVKDGELLNTELRIYALVRLGINDSVKISEFLHCSAQTVYNNRLRCRNKALIPKNEFAQTVMSLGKAAL